MDLSLHILSPPHHANEPGSRMHVASISYDTHKMDILLSRADDFPLILRTLLSPDIDLLYIVLPFISCNFVILTHM